MAKIFNDLAYGQFVPTYAGIPLEAAEKTADTLDTRFRENKAAQDQLEIMIDNLKVRDQNRPHVQAALTKAQNELAQIREQGDWENAGFLVQKAAKDFAMDKGVRGALQDKEQYDAYMADLDKRLKEDKIDSITYNNAKSLAVQENQKSVEYDPVTGEYKNIFSAYSPQNFQDIQKATFEMGEKWKSSKEPRIIEYTDKSGKKMQSRVVYDPILKGYNIVGTKEYLTENELQSGLRQAVLANPKYKGYIQEGLMFDKALKFGVGENKRDITMSDIFSGDSGVRSMFNISEEKAKEMVEKLGMDYNAIAQDPDMIEALYDVLHMNKAVDGYVNPAASAYSFENIEEKYLTDHVMMEAIKHRNAMALRKYDWQNRWAMQKDSQAFQLKQNAPVITHNPGAVTKGNEFNSKEMSKAITQTQAQLAEAKRKLEANKKGQGGDANAITKQIKDLEFTLATQQNTMNGYRKRYLETPKGQAFLDKQYAAYQQQYPQGTDLHLTREEFEKRVIEGNNDTSGVVAEINPATMSKEGFGFPTITKTPEGARNQLLNNINKSLGSNIDQFVAENTPQSWGGQILQSADTKSYVNRQNKTLTTMVLNNRTNYVTGGGLQLNELIENAAGKAGKQGVEINVAMTSADNNGDFPHYITIKDKATGKTITEEMISSRTGGAEERYNTGVAMMKEFQPGSESYQIGNYMAASASFPAWKSQDIDGQLSIVTDRDPAGEVATSESFVAGTNNLGQPMHFKVEKSRQKFFNDDGTLAGINTVQRLLQVDPNNPDNVLGSLENPSSPGSNIFYSQDDMKVALFNQLNPNPDINQYQITGYKQSSSSGAGIKSPIQSPTQDSQETPKS